MSYTAHVVVFAELACGLTKHKCRKKVQTEVVTFQNQTHRRLM